MFSNTEAKSEKAALEEKIATLNGKNCYHTRKKVLPLIVAKRQGNEQFSFVKKNERYSRWQIE